MTTTIERPTSSLNQTHAPNGRKPPDRVVENAVEIHGLSKRFGQFTAVDSLSFDVPTGSIFGFLGPNGAGKTTTLGMLLGLVPYDAGGATMLGCDIHTQLPEALSRTGALVERPAFYPYLSGRRNLALFARVAGINDSARIQRALEEVDLLSRADAKFGGYSTGMKQRLGIAAALIRQPELIILDEPTSGLDPAGQLEIRNLVRELAGAGRTILLSSHLLNEVQQVCTHVAIIDKGRLVQTGTLEQLLTGESVVEIRVVDRTPEAARFLRDFPGVSNVDILDGRLIVKVPADQCANINRALVVAGFDVNGLNPRESKLEERFLDLTNQFEKEA
ncbi:MAG: ABC transporter ATP-binding protein [Nitrolancea sp.]